MSDERAGKFPTFDDIFRLVFTYVTIWIVVYAARLVGYITSRTVRTIQQVITPYRAVTFPTIWENIRRTAVRGGVKTLAILQYFKWQKFQYKAPATELQLFDDTDDEYYDADATNTRDATNVNDTEQLPEATVSTATSPTSSVVTQNVEQDNTDNVAGQVNSDTENEQQIVNVVRPKIVSVKSSVHKLPVISEAPSEEEVVRRALQNSTKDRWVLFNLEQAANEKLQAALTSLNELKKFSPTAGFGILGQPIAETILRFPTPTDFRPKTLQKIEQNIHKQAYIDAINQLIEIVNRQEQQFRELLVAQAQIHLYCNEKLQEKVHEWQNLFEAYQKSNSEKYEFLLRAQDDRFHQTEEIIHHGLEIKVQNTLGDIYHELRHKLDTSKLYKKAVVLSATDTPSETDSVDVQPSEEVERPAHWIDFDRLPHGRRTRSAHAHRRRQQKRLDVLQAKRAGNRE